MSCSEKKVAERDAEPEVSAIPPYDTIPVDSFSAGATSIDIEAQIRRSTLKYQDSLKRAKEAQAQAEQIKKAKESEATSTAKKPSDLNSESKTAASPEVKIQP